MHPIVAATATELIDDLHHDLLKLQQAPQLTPEQRSSWLEVFVYGLTHRLNKPWKEIIKMISAVFPRTEDLQWGRELKEIFTKEAELKVGISAATKQLESNRRLLRLYDDLLDQGKLDATTYESLRTPLAEQTDETQTQLDDLKTQLSTVPRVPFFGD